MAAKKTKGEDGDIRLLVQVATQQGYLEKALDGLKVDMKEQTNTLLAAMQTHANDDTMRFDRNDVRLKILEKWHWKLLGASAVVAAVAGAIVHFLTKT